MKNNDRKCPGENTPASGERRLERRRERKMRSEGRRETLDKDERKQLKGKKVKMEKEKQEER